MPGKEIKGKFYVAELETKAKAEKPTTLKLTGSCTLFQDVKGKNGSKRFEIALGISIKGEEPGMQAFLKRLNILAASQHLPFLLERNPQTSLEEPKEETNNAKG